MLIMKKLLLLFLFLPIIGDHVKHLPYEKSASIYVSKFICDDKIDYGFVVK